MHRSRRSAPATIVPASRPWVPWPFRPPSPLGSSRLPSSAGGLPPSDHGELAVRFALNTKQERGQEACRESGAAQIRADSTTSVVEWMGGPGAKRSAGHEIPQETRE